MFLRSLGVDTASTRDEVIAWSNDGRVTNNVLTEALAIVKAKYPDKRISSAFMAWAVEEIINPKQQPPPKTKYRQPQDFSKMNYREGIGDDGRIS